jgi:ABC-type Fe3+-siderophore transport system permease subunit
MGSLAITGWSEVLKSAPVHPCFIRPDLSDALEAERTLDGDEEAKSLGVNVQGTV